MAESQTQSGASRTRPAELITACQNRLVKHLLAYVTPVFDNTIENLFEMAEKGVDTAEQNRIFEAQQILRNKKTAFTEDLSEELTETFRRFQSNDPADKEPEDEPEPELHDEMSLVEEQDLEESLAISDMVSKAEVRFTQAIYALNQRLAILNGGRAVKNDTNPCGPLQIGRSLRAAAQCLPLKAEFKVKVYHRFDRLFQKNISTCYEEMNDHLAEAGILPNIRFESPQRPKRPAPPPPGYQESPPEAEQAYPEGAAGDAPMAAPPPGGMPAPAPGAPPAAGGGVDFFGRVLAGAGTASPSGQAMPPGQAPGPMPHGQMPPGQMPQGQMPPGQAPQGQAQAGQEAGAPASGGGFSAVALRNLLARAGVTSAPAGPAPSGPMIYAQPQRLQSALSQLQTRLSGAGATSAGRISPEDIKKRLSKALGKDPETGEPMALAERDSQTIDIMGMLYEHIDRENALNQQVQSLLHSLQVPMIRVALQDDEFFDSAEHPARQFFNTVAEAGELWLEDKPEESPTYEKMKTAIEHVLEEYEGDNEVFKGLLGDLDKHIRVLSRKASLAEKRHVEAARGQEKLENAREQAHRLVDKLIQKYHPPKFVESVLSQPWCDVLALTVLRSGDDSDEWQKALTVAKTLIFSVRDDLDEGVKANLRKRVDWLRKELAQGLSQVGYFEQDVKALLANLEACHRWSLAEEKVEEVPQELSQPLPSSEPEEEVQEPEAEAQSEAQPESQAEAKTDAEAETDAEGEGAAKDGDGEKVVKPNLKKAPKPKPVPKVPTPARPKKPELSDQEKAMLAKIRLMAFGTWFELKLDEEADWVKRKLSWYSPISGRCLFVNNRGSVAEEISLYQLAQMMSAGSARVFRADSKPLIDRAMDAIFGRLKKLASTVAPA